MLNNVYAELFKHFPKIEIFSYAFETKFIWKLKLQKQIYVSIGQNLSFKTKTKKKKKEKKICSNFLLWTVKKTVTAIYIYSIKT